MAVELKTDEDFNLALNQNSKVIVKYYADWCGSCRLFSPKFRRLSEDQQFSDVSFLDVNAEKSPEARKLAGVTNLPFFATFKDGELVSGQPTSKEEAVVEMIKSL
ncbi:thioredoxin family protein [Ekhidna sp. To15]|uniref:thioredoxin family protein n=1 Tax=Ekhidna sp. To15 TaxID=3395267 RepID=UPI003F524116